MRSKLAGLLTLLTTVALLGGQAVLADRAAPAAAAAAPQGGQTWQVIVGAQSADRAVQMLQYYPVAVTVNVGDTITWTDPTPEIHTVTFLAPGQERPEFDRGDPLQTEPQGNPQIDGSGYLNSGILENGSSFTATATQPGTYEYLCLVHRLQVGSVLVNPAGTAYPQTQADYTATMSTAEPVIAQWQARLGAYQPESPRRRADGTAEHVIFSGMGDGVAATMRFIPQALEVRVGDTITWDNDDIETPHTVTFGPPQGPPQGAWGNPQAFDGMTPLNSGRFGPAWPAGKTYSVTFTSPGQFSYVCLLHVGAFMLGTMSVGER
jgi:plastocyanin